LRTEKSNKGCETKVGHDEDEDGAVRRLAKGARIRLY
jgi:hypothetical protein